MNTLKSLIVLALTTIAIGCGSVEPNMQIDGRIQPVLDAFVRDANMAGVTIDFQPNLKILRVVKFEDKQTMQKLSEALGDHEAPLGVCLFGKKRDGNDLSPAAIKDAFKAGGKSHWSELHILAPGADADADFEASIDDEKFRTIVYHELAHCLLGKVGHSTVEDSLLNERLPRIGLGRTWQDKVSELFTYQYLKDIEDF